MSKKSKIKLFRILFALLWLVLTAVAECTLAPGMRLLKGVPRGMTVIMAAVALADGPVAGLAAGLSAGLLTDAMCGNTLCFYTVCYTICGTAIGEIMSDSHGRGVFWSALWSGAVIFATELLRFFFFFYLFGRAGIGDALAVIFASILYTVLLSPILSGPILWTRKMGKRERPLL